MRTTTSDKRIAFWPVALAGLVTMAVAVSGPVLIALIALLALAAALALVRVLPMVVAYLLVASAASVPLGWLSPDLGIIGGLGVLLWLSLSAGWMMVHGAHVLPRCVPGPDGASAVEWGLSTPSSA
jgi:hypothetical protein